MGDLGNISWVFFYFGTDAMVKVISLMVWNILLYIILLSEYKQLPTGPPRDFDDRYSKTLIKSAPKYQIIWRNNWKNSSDCAKALNLCHKFDDFSQSELFCQLFPKKKDI